MWLWFSHLLARFLTPLLPIAAIAVGRSQWRRWRAAGELLAVAGAVTGAMFVVPLLREPLDPSPVHPGEESAAVVGLTDLSFMQPNFLLDAIKDPNMQVGLVGDAQAFFFQIPSSRLHYKTVFDVPAGDIDDITAWLGTDPIGNAEYRMILNTQEIQRLHDTYYKTPPLNPAWKNQGTFYLAGNSAKEIR